MLTIPLRGAGPSTVSMAASNCRCARRWRSRAAMITQPETSTMGSPTRRSSTGQGRTTSGSAEATVAKVQVAMYIGMGAMLVVALPIRASELATRTSNSAVQLLEAATDIFPVRSCQIVTSPTPPASKGTTKAVTAGPATTGVARLVAAITAAGSSKGTETPILMKSIASALRVAATSLKALISSGLLSLPTPRFVTSTVRPSASPTDLDG
mmetsp:Transcript_165782/g.532351  ORF Transcript_165782/g.532351 Transcript_165782/m.532351 type:complete len:211 (+) Transcript_165782:1954-2586(+)